MRNSLIIAGFVLALSPTLTPHTSFAADADAPKQITAEDLANTPPSGTFEFEGSQIRLLVGGGSGKGVHLQDRSRALGGDRDYAGWSV